MNRRIFLSSGMLAACSLIGVPPAHAQIANINDAINKSGRQRMLSQRMAKAYLQLGQAIDVERSKKVLEQSVSLFDQQLTELKAFSPMPENKTALLEMSLAWSSYKGVLTGTMPNPRDARTVLTLNEEILVVAQASTVQLEKHSGSAIGRFVNMSGRQRMLSQRMAKFYQAINWGIATPDAHDKLLDARKEFVAAMAQLCESQRNTPEIVRALELAQMQWVFFDNAIGVSAAGSHNRAQLATNVATTSERILEVMEQITGMYEKLG